MGILHSPENAYSQEMCKWEAIHTAYGPPGKPFVHQDYPMMMYKAGLVQHVGIVDLMHPPDPVGITAREVADDEVMRRNLESRGFVAGGPKAAVDAWHQAQQAVAMAAAVRNADDLRISEKAHAEVLKAESESFGHLAAIPEKPIKRRGRAPGSKNKPKAVADGQ